MANQLKFDAVLFDLDDTLFNSTLMSQTARRNAIRAIREAGVELDEDEAFDKLMQIVEEYGSNYGEHFNRLIEELGYEIHPKLIAAAIVAYHSSKYALLRPFPDVILTLLTLMKADIKIGIISDGIKVKQWEKLMYLGIQHFFDVVIINDLPSQWKPANYSFDLVMQKLNFRKPEKLIYIGNKIDTDIIGANRAGFVSVLFDPAKKIDVKTLEGEKKPQYHIQRINEIIEIIGLKPIRWRF
ncbi:MAG: TIGR02253 family HAD-type hydrolase [Asgard group archaeon]|nr:TIGR02253 family HAD-type hydrolase [Asgard group archaeon]